MWLKSVFSRVQNKIFSRFLYSYIGVLLITLLLSLIAYVPLTRIVESDAREANITMLNQVVDIMDKRFSEIQTLAVQLSANTKVQTLMYLKKPLVETDQYRIWDSYRDLSPYSVTNNFIVDFYIYFKNIDVILGPHAKYEPSLFYADQFQYTGITFDEWNGKILNRTHQREFMPGSEAVYGGKTLKIVTYLQSIPVSSFDESLATLVIMIDENEIKRLMERINVTQKGFICVLDSEDNVILGVNHEEAEVENLLLTTKQSRNGSFYQTMSGQNMVVTYCTSNTGWRYITVIPRSFVLEKVRNIEFILLLVIAVCLVIGIAAAYIFAGFNSRPVWDIVKLIHQKAGIVLTGDNEFNLIKSAVTKIIEDENNVKIILDQQMPVLKNDFLQKILRGEFYDEAEILTSADFLKMDLRSKAYGVIILRLTNYSGDAIYNSDLHVYRTVVLGVIKDMVQQVCKGPIIELKQNELGVILTDNDELFKEKLKEIAIKIKEMIEKDSHIKLAISVGKVYQNVLGISKAFDEARKVMDYAVLKGEERILFYDEMSYTDEAYYYPADKEMWILEHVKLGDYPGIRKLLDSIYKENFSTRNISSGMVEYLLFELKSTVIKVLNDLRLSEVIDTAKESTIVEKLMQCSNIKEMMQTLDIIYSELCAAINSSRIDSLESLKEEILQYIQENYHDKELSLAKMAGFFSLSESYISRVFNEKIGDGLAEYVNKLRVARAKEKLQSGSNLSMRELASELGYGTERTFFRVFKDIVGMTPSQYKGANRNDIK